MTTGTANDLALLGGAPVRQTPLPTPPRATGPQALDNLRQVLERADEPRAGVWVKRLEEEFGATYGARHCTASTSGTSAIHVAVGAIDPEPGDEIITAPITDMGTVIPILAQNAIPVFADVERETFNLDPADVERRITPRTRAIIPVHLGGNPCHMEALLDIARRHQLQLIEDCSQAYCASYQGRRVGTMGDIGCFSMQQSKHFTVGDGGLTITNDHDLGRRIALFADKGWPRYSAEGARTYLAFGFNYHMTELQGPSPSLSCPWWRGSATGRTRNGERLTGLLHGLPGVHPQRVRPGDHSTYWFFALRAVARRRGAPAALRRGGARRGRLLRLPVHREAHLPLRGPAPEAHLRHLGVPLLLAGRSPRRALRARGVPQLRGRPGRDAHRPPARVLGRGRA